MEILQNTKTKKQKKRSKKNYLDYVIDSVFWQSYNHVDGIACGAELQHRNSSRNSAINEM